MSEIAGGTPTPDSSYWAADRYQHIANRLMPISTAMCDLAKLRANELVLDVGCSTGNASLTAARRQCKTTGIDLDPGMLAVAARRAETEMLAVTFRRADMQRLPFSDESFDAVLSAYAAMFAEDARATVAELLRVCRPNGRIVLAHWNPDSVITGMFALLNAYCPDVDDGTDVASRWGTADGLSELFGTNATIYTRPRHIHVEAISAKHWAENICLNFGPARQTLAAADADTGRQIRHELAELFHRYDETDTPGVTRIRVDYLEGMVTPIRRTYVSKPPVGAG